MKKFKCLFAIPALALALGLASCGNTENPSTTTGNNNADTTTTVDSGDSKETTTNTADEKTCEYRVCVQTLAGKPLKAVQVKIKANGETHEEYTDSKGYASFTLDKGTYKISVEELPGYSINEEKTDALLTDPTGETTVTRVVMDTHLILADEEEEPSQPTYTEGDVMYDTTFTAVDGKAYQLSDLFENGKELVVINYWYTTCSWCVTEFPYLEAAYEKLKDKVEVIALNIAVDDTAQDAKSFMESNNLTMPCAMDTTHKYANAIDLSGCPTSVFIDRYGQIAKIEVGALTTESKWTGAMNQYLGNDYVPSYSGYNEDGEAVIVKPTTTYPGDAAIKNAAAVEGFDGEFYTETGNDAEYNWPWVVSKDGNSIMASNQKIDNSYSILYLDVTIPENKVLTVDYKTSTESDDYLYIISNSKILLKASEIDAEFQTAYLYVADKETDITIGICYKKDSGSFDGEDTVYLKDFRLIDIDDVETELYVIRDCARDYNSFTHSYDSYIEAVYNEEDGFYYTSDGKLLYACLNDEYTPFSELSMYEYCIDGVLDFGDVDYTNIITQYANYGSNSTIAFMGLNTFGLTPITKELMEALVDITNRLGEKSYENQWQEVCCYIDMYNVEGDPIGNPIKGLAPFTAYEAQVGVDNYVTFDRPIMPRGLYMKFTAETAGVYNIYSINEVAPMDCWIFNSNNKKIQTMDQYNIDYREYYELEYRISHKEEVFFPQFFSYMYLEAGQTIYIVPAFQDMYEYSTIQVAIDYLGAKVDIMKTCSYATFTTSNDDMSGDIIATKNLDYALGTDGYYHPVRNGKIVEEDFLYADFLYTTGPFDRQNLQQIAATGGFDFTVDEDDNPASGEDCTDRIEAYFALINDDKDSIYYGTVKVDKELADLLQMLCEKYLFAGVEESWLKVCYYVDHLGN